MRGLRDSHSSLESCCLMAREGNAGFALLPTWVVEEAAISSEICVPFGEGGTRLRLALPKAPHKTSDNPYELIIM